MKAIILAAGSGTRMGALTENLPKGMLNVNGKTVIERQLEVLREIGVNDIIVVTGFQAEKIAYKGVRYYHNSLFATTNMVESLMCARAELTEDVIVAYADIVYSKDLAKAVASSPYDIGVAVDEAWRDYWMLRYGTTETDLESLSVSKDAMITDIGRPLDSSTGVNYRYIGLLKFSKRGLDNIFSVYDKRKASRSLWPQSGKPFEKGYMTDILHESIVSRFPVQAIVVKQGWVEFDTVEDYEVGLRCLSNPDTLRGK